LLQHRVLAENANQGAATAKLAKLRGAINAFYSDTGLYPLTLTDLTVTSAPANGYNAAGTSTSLSASLWNGPYLQSIDTEPVYKTSYTYSRKTDRTPNYYTVDPTIYAP
ncbi:MAG: type II secretion system protein GspG, partial [Armatimonadota bacterium]